MKKLFIIVGVFLCSAIGTSQMQEDFESVGISPFWAVFNNGLGANTWTTTIDSSYVCVDSKSAIMDARQDIGNGNISKNWMATHLVTIPNNGELKFLAKSSLLGYNNTKLQIQYSINSQNTVADFQLIQEFLDSDLPVNRCEEMIVDLSLLSGQQVYLAFVVEMEQLAGLTGDIIYIDNILLVEKCNAPYNLQVINSTENSIELGWQESNNATSWELSVYDADTQAQVIAPYLVGSNPFTVHFLTPGTRYNFYVKSNCEFNNFSLPAYIQASTDVYCDVPVSFVYNHIGTNATLSWSNRSNATQWEVEIAPTTQNFTNNTFIINTNPYTFQNLDPNETYKVKIRTICNFENQIYFSNWNYTTCAIANIFSSQRNSNAGELCINREVSFMGELAPIYAEVQELRGLSSSTRTFQWYFYDENDYLLGTSNNARPSFVFSQPGYYYCKLNYLTEDCNDWFRYDFEVKDCPQPTCFIGTIQSNETLCSETDNSFWFIPSGIFNYTQPGLNFTWTVTQNGTPVFFETINNNTAINLSHPEPGNYVVTLIISNGLCSNTIVKNVTITHCNSDSCQNSANQNFVIGLFKNLLQHLKTQPVSSIVNGYSCPELIALLPYIDPVIVDPKIYDFTSVNGVLSFSFSSNEASPHVIFNTPLSVLNNHFVSLYLDGYVNMSGTTNFIGYFFLFDPFFPIFLPLPGSTVSKIDFCPDELLCVNHIAIVLDESTSISPVDAGRIRSQLKNFIEQQLAFNQTQGSQLKVSLIGLSDQDTDIRTDHIINLAVNPANKQIFLNWIAKYKNRYNSRLPGVTSNSDYWNSGLYRAARTDASLVILITDGAQANSLSTLQNTLNQYNNRNAVSEKHLYILGLNKGYYIDGESGMSARYNEASNPNYFQETINEDDETIAHAVEFSSQSKRLTDFLRLSLRYLIYQNTQFPIETKTDFTGDYSAHTNFKFLYDDPYYLSNGIYNFFGQTCGDEQYLERCDDCYGVQLDIKQNYIISAWVHVDKTQQVKSFQESHQAPSIEIHFCDEGDIDEGDANLAYLSETTEEGIVYPGKFEFFPQGNIIDGWQRILGVFKVHPETVYLKIILKNGSEFDAMHFDDIRIHPREGNIKTFVYDEENYRLMAELDENNYSTYYEYDAEGGLVRVKKETEKGIKTIQESRSGTVTK